MTVVILIVIAVAGDTGELTFWPASWASRVLAASAAIAGHLPSGLYGCPQEVTLLADSLATERRTLLPPSLATAHHH